MNLTSAAQEQQTAIGPIHLATIRGLTFLEMCSLITDEAADAKVARGIDEAKVRLAGELISRAGTGSDARFELVSALRARILAGTYRVAAEDVAESLMGTMRG